MYIAIKYIHILSAIVMIGTTTANGLLELRSTMKKDAPLSAYSMGTVQLFNYALMVPSLVILPTSGLLLVDIAGYSLQSSWLLISLVFMVALWIAFAVGHRAESRMAYYAERSAAAGQPLSEEYFQAARHATRIGLIATTLALITLYMMIAKRPPFL